MSGLGAFIDGALKGYSAGGEIKDDYQVRHSASEMAKQGLSVPEQMQGMAQTYAGQGKTEQAAQFYEKASKMRKEGYEQALDDALAGKDPNAIMQKFNASGTMKLKDLQVEPYIKDIPGYGAVVSARMRGTMADGKPFAMEDAFGARVRAMDIGQQLDLREKQVQLGQTADKTNLALDAGNFDLNKARKLLPSELAQAGLKTDAMSFDLGKSRQMLDGEMAQQGLRTAGMGHDYASAVENQNWKREDRPIEQAANNIKMADASQQLMSNQEKGRNPVPVATAKQWEVEGGVMYNPYSGESKPISKAAGGEPDYYAKELFKSKLGERQKMSELMADPLLDPEQLQQVSQRAAALDSEIERMQGKEPPASAAKTAPAQAIEYLKANNTPDMQAAFKAHYGYLP